MDASRAGNTTGDERSTVAYQSQSGNEVVFTSFTTEKQVSRRSLMPTNKLEMKIHRPRMSKLKDFTHQATKSVLVTISGRIEVLCATVATTDAE